MAKIKVSQATIDKIKTMGMTKALKGAGSASPEMKEALKRMYGAKRVAAAGGAASKPASSGGGKYVGSRFVPNTPAPKKPSASGAVYKSADAARAAATTKKAAVSVPSKAGFGATNMPNKNTKPGNFGTGSVRKAGTNMPKKSVTTDPFAKFVFGVGTALRGNNTKTVAQVSAINAKRLGISVAEYNKRLNAKKTK